MSLSDIDHFNKLRLSFVSVDVITLDIADNSFPTESRPNEPIHQNASQTPKKLFSSIYFRMSFAVLYNVICESKAFPSGIGSLPSLKSDICSCVIQS